MTMLPSKRDLSSRYVSTDTCGNSADRDGSNYDLSLHIGSVFIILCVSATACAFPLLVSKVPQLRIPPKFLFVVRHFGTGVLIATAFVHLLPTAFVSLTDPCLPSFWNEEYPAMAGAIALLAVFFITTIEMAFTGRHTCAFPTSMMDPDSKAPEDTEKRKSQNMIGDSISTANTTLTQEMAQAHFPTLTKTQQQHRALLQCVLLEAGILFHSVFIGMALAVAVGGNFVVLLIAISFHQTFEGLALGSRIASISWEDHERGAYQPWLMALAYGCTTPVGQIIGIATHSLYDPSSMTGLLMVGIMNAISSGLLIFASLVDLLQEDFLSDHSWSVLRGRRRVLACVLVVAGAFLMALIGAWA